MKLTILITLISAVMLFTACQSNTDDSSTQFTFGAGKRSLSLNGTWKFRSGDDPSWSHPDLPDDDWKPQMVPGLWARNDAVGYGIGFGLISLLM